MTKSMKFRTVPVVMLAVLGLLAAACGSDDDTSTDDTSKDTSTESTDGAEKPASLGDPNPATGDPVTIGFIGEGQTDALDNTGELVAAQATVEYANEYLGGVGGREIVLKTCETGGTPAGAQECVAEMASAGAVVILNGVSGQAPTITAEATNAGIPFIQYAGIDRATIGSEDTAVITNGLSALAGPAKVAADAGDKKVAFIVTDVPAAADPVKAAAPIFFGNAGVEVEVITIPPGTADATPQVQTAIGNGADHISMIGDVTHCTAVIQAAETLGFEGNITVIPQCFDENSPDVIDTEGLIMPTTRTSNPDDAEYALFLDVMDTYASGGSTDDIAGGGFGAVLSFVRAMKGHPEGEMTPASVKQALLVMEPAQIPLGLDGTMFQCNREQIKIAPSVCSTTAVVTTLDAKGKPTEYKPLELADLLVIG
jgi:branched-chain amino acid transport system substrate-binding protein